MKVTAIIAEYNPFHNGHLKQIRTAKRETKPDALVVLMSGSFTQRGDIAIVDKYTRAQWAIDAGADMVLELPTVYSLSNANGFAKGAIKTLSMLGDYTLSFGTEEDELKELKMATEFLQIETNDETKMIRSFLKEGYSKAKSKTMALGIRNPQVANMIKCPNNILAICYMSEVMKQKQNVTFHNVPRKPDDMVKYASSTKIRKMLNNGEDVENLVPKFVDLSKTINPTKADAITMYSVKSKTAEQLRILANISEGIENRIERIPVTTTKEFLEAMTNKRYSRSTIKRIMASAVVNLKEELVKLAYDEKPYCVVLACKKSKKDQLFKLLSESDGYFYYKHSDCTKDSPVYPLVQLDVKAAKIQNLCM